MCTWCDRSGVTKRSIFLRALILKLNNIKYFEK